MPITKRAFSFVLDDLDRLFLDELARDGRATSSDLAALAGISKVTAASRVRRLIDEEVVRVTAVFDMIAAGFPWQINCFIASTDGNVRRIATELAKIRSTVLVAGVLGNFDVLVTFVFADQAEMERLLLEQLPLVQGVGRFDCDIVVRPLWFEPFAYNAIVGGYHTTPDFDMAVDIRPSLIELDDLDRSMIKMLRIDGRRSNRRISQDLNVSEGTIRTRIRRMQEVDLMRIVGVPNPRALDHVAHVAWMRVRLESARPSEASAALAAVREVTSVTAILGRANLNVMAVVSDRQQLRDAIAAVRSVTGVVDVDHYELTSTEFYRSYFARIPARAVRESGTNWAVDRPASTQTAG